MPLKINNDTLKSNKPTLSMFVNESVQFFFSSNSWSDIKYNENSNKLL